jgi:ribonuclease D
MNKTLHLLRTDLDASLAARLRNARRIALDIETSGLDPLKDKIGTVQVYAPEIGAIIIQLGAGFPGNLRDLLADERTLKIFHHAMFDLRFMVRHWKVEPTNVACTKVASKLLFPGMPNGGHSLQALLAEHLDIKISKDQRVTNWLAADLTPEQIEYACRDVVHLLPLLDCLEDQLRRAGLHALFRACVEFLPTRVQLDLGGWPDVFGY